MGSGKRDGAGASAHSGHPRCHRGHREEAESMKAIFASSEIAGRVERALKELAAQVQCSVPAVRCTVQHGGNDNFPWWLVARFANGADESKVVDVSIECRGTSQDWTIRADLARENGWVIRESSALSSSAPAEWGGTTRRAGGGRREATRRLLERTGGVSSSGIGVNRGKGTRIIPKNDPRPL